MTRSRDYADFLDYAAGAGQVAGFELGALPIGYLPLPQALRDQAIAAAVTIRELQPPPPVPAPNAEVPTPSTITPSVAPAAESPPSVVASTTEPTDVENSASPSPGALPSRSAPRGSSAVGAPDTPPTSEVVSSPGETPAATEAPPLLDATVDEASEAPSLVRSLVTPILAVGRSRYAVPGLGIVALRLSMLGALEITKRPRRGLVADELTTPEGG